MSDGSKNRNVGDKSSNDQKKSVEESADLVDVLGKLSLGASKGSELPKKKAEPPEELSESEKKFIERFKNFRLELDLSHAGVGRELGELYGNGYSGEHIKKFENLKLSASNIRKLIPILRNWMEKRARK